MSTGRQGWTLMLGYLKRFVNTATRLVKFVCSPPVRAAGFLRHDDVVFSLLTWDKFLLEPAPVGIWDSEAEWS